MIGSQHIKKIVNIPAADFHEIRTDSLTEPQVEKVPFVLPLRYNFDNDSIDDAKGRVIASLYFTAAIDDRERHKQDGDFIVSKVNGYAQLESENSILKAQLANIVRAKSKKER